MNNIILGLGEKWEALSLRERWILEIGAAIFIVVLGYRFIIFPLWDGAQVAQQGLEKRQALLTWLERAAPRVLAARPIDAGNERETYDSVLSLLEKKAEDPRLKPHVTALGLVANTGIRLTLEAIVFEDLIAWMWDLSHIYDVNVVSLTVNETEKSGAVNAELVYQQQL